MKPTLLTLTLAASFLSALAQDTTYFNMMWRQTTVQNAAYYQIKVRKDAGWQISNHWLSGKTEMTGTYSDDSLHIRQGEYIWYDSSGNVNHRCIYDHNKQNGPETYYYGNGRTRMTGANLDDQAEGKWSGYYPSGKVAAEAVYKQGKQISGKFYHEDGAPDKSIKDFVRESEFPGGP